MEYMKLSKNKETVEFPRRSLPELVAALQSSTSREPVGLPILLVILLYGCDHDLIESPARRTIWFGFAMQLDSMPETPLGVNGYFKLLLPLTPDTSCAIMSVFEVNQMSIDVVALWIGRIVVYGSIVVAAVWVFCWTVRWASDQMVEGIICGLDWLDQRKEKRCATKRHG